MNINNQIFIQYNKIMDTFVTTSNQSSRATKGQASCPANTLNSGVSSSSSNSNSSSNIRINVPKCIDKSKKPLPVNFEPSDYSIICGNKRQYFNSPGNRRLRVLVQSHIQEYCHAVGKVEKSSIVTKVMNIIREACPVGSFVTFENGRWWSVSERTSREKVGSYFRDCLGGKYRSSAQNKIAKRKSKRMEKKQLEALPDTVASLYEQQMKLDRQFRSLDLPATRPRSENVDCSSSSSVSSGNSATFYDVDDLTNVPLLDF